MTLIDNVAIFENVPAVDNGVELTGRADSLWMVCDCYRMEDLFFCGPRSSSTRTDPTRKGSPELSLSRFIFFDDSELLQRPQTSFKRAELLVTFGPKTTGVQIYILLW